MVPLACAGSQRGQAILGDWASELQKFWQLVPPSGEHHGLRHMHASGANQHLVAPLPTSSSGTLCSSRTFQFRTD